MKFPIILIALALLCMGAEAKYSPPLEVAGKVTAWNGTSGQELVTLSQMQGNLSRANGTYTNFATGASYDRPATFGSYDVYLGRYLDWYYTRNKYGLPTCVTHNATRAIEVALTAGGNIEIENGTYQINKRFNRTLQNGETIHIRGNNAYINCSVLPRYTDDWAVFNFGQNVVPENYRDNPVIIEDLQLNVNGASQSNINARYQAAGFRFQRVWNPYLRNVRVLNAAWCGFAFYRYWGVSTDPEWYDKATGFMVDHCELINCGLDVNGMGRDYCFGGIYATNWVYGGLAIGNTVRNCYYGIVLEDVANGILVTGNTVKNSTMSGYFVRNSYGSAISGNYAYFNGFSGFETWDDCRFTRFTDNYAYRNNNFGFRINNSERVIVDANSAYYNGDCGLVLEGAHNNHVSDNMFINNGGIGPYNAGIRDNGNHNLITDNVAGQDPSLSNAANAAYGLYQGEGSDYGHYQGNRNVAATTALRYSSNTAHDHNY